MAQGSRPDRVADQIRSELALLLSREVHDPGIGFVTLTRVRVSPDLQVARVSYTVLGDDKARQSSAKALDRAAPFLRRQIGQRLRLKRTPEIRFHYDEAVAGQDRIERILNELHGGTQNDDESDDDA
jgi:ribosome-binding factor A